MTNKDPEKIVERMFDGAHYQSMSTTGSRDISIEDMVSSVIYAHDDGSVDFYNSVSIKPFPGMSINLPVKIKTVKGKLRIGGIEDEDPCKIINLKNLPDVVENEFTIIKCNDDLPIVKSASYIINGCGFKDLRMCRETTSAVHLRMIKSNLDSLKDIPERLIELAIGNSKVNSFEFLPSSCDELYLTSVFAADKSSHIKHPLRLCMIQGLVHVQIESCDTPIMLIRRYIEDSMIYEAAGALIEADFEDWAML